MNRLIQQIVSGSSDRCRSGQLRADPGGGRARWWRGGGGGGARAEWRRCGRRWRQAKRATQQQQGRCTHQRCPQHQRQQRQRQQQCQRQQNVNVNVDVDQRGGWDHPVAGAMVVGGAIAVTAAAIGSMVNTVPTGCVPINYGGMIYQQCGSTWYQPQGSQFVVVNPPN